ncbi:Tripartite ATP-independent periplasmic transporter DctQ component [Alkalidesulfovibrio alkalitolerans DSM 16529]|jgi:TRAP-type C4-dicarboxylate transport system permease small subunit|uniref:Tripartite ATP-independent periplasmic transporter DctQ component n=1 Tax=Alkalidesulfovibrio alkalitolerans DSM 16529 TaxID=1121439 RepID=S7TCC7_9BACT|nr:TRAP transporter small permease [Alkalidesulfovibrio alkalitolerans]EPR34862.1 Tripartite ATP-independent periplasmic transporter DctQ component [Alkalidesulfovibrio alkalitolerans DSM 16529]
MTHDNGSGHSPLASAVERFGYRLNWLLERVCALLVAAMIGIVWFGVVERYYLHWGMTWAEELARYVMIWAALLAVPVCAYRREHIGLDILFSRFPISWQPGLRLTLDLLGLAFFVFMAYYGIEMARQGAGQFATIFGMTMLVPFLSVPVSCGLTAMQIVVCMVRDGARITPLFIEKEARQ